MQLSETVKLYMTKEQKMLITETMTEYINTVNGLVSDAANGISIAKYTSKDVNANLPSALINQCIRDAKSINRKQNIRRPVLRQLPEETLLNVRIPMRQ